MEMVMINARQSVQESEQLDRMHQAVNDGPSYESLIGSFFHGKDVDGKGLHGWTQGCVVAEPVPGIYLVEYLDWLGGGSDHQALVRIKDMMDWRFYDTAEWMKNDYEYNLKQEYEGKQQ